MRARSAQRVRTVTGAGRGCARPSGGRCQSYGGLVLTGRSAGSGPVQAGLGGAAAGGGAALALDMAYPCPGGECTRPGWEIESVDEKGVALQGGAKGQNISWGKIRKNTAQSPGLVCVSFYPHPHDLVVFYRVRFKSLRSIESDSTAALRRDAAACLGRTERGTHSGRVPAPCHSVPLPSLPRGASGAIGGRRAGLLGCCRSWKSRPSRRPPIATCMRGAGPAGPPGPEPRQPRQPPATHGVYGVESCCAARGSGPNIGSPAQRPHACGPQGVSVHCHSYNNFLCK